MKSFSPGKKVSFKKEKESPSKKRQKSGSLSVKEEQDSIEKTPRKGQISSSSSESDSAKDSDEEDIKKPIIREAIRQQEVVASEKVKEFMQKQSNLSLTAPTNDDPDVKVFSEEEVFILQCHKSINPETLLSRKIALTGCTKIEDNGLEFTIDKFPESTSKTVTLVSCHDAGRLKAETYPVVGKITLTESTEKPEICYTFTQDNAPEEFPRSLKVRHPLLGANFEEKFAEIANVVIKEESPEVELTRKSLKRRRNREEDTASPKKSPLKKKMKREREEISSDLQWIQNV